ncbi:hypothetical protein LSH36_673g01000 [Paralvinella palmiformis]|uniref:Trafficking protein particle complex subunit 13 n=1 Tax=Paralvinella palmiformis TaxID=53620 RepID=A0AAD9J4N2_9ANNE|nr:hypothetical protein LSH36_673g01000 [Paralvinella palmiformis]
MRLTKPSLMASQRLSCDPRDLPQDAFQTMMIHDLAAPKGLDHFSLGELLTLPQNFGNIFLGETFSSYISVHNDSTQTCRDILVKVLKPLDVKTRFHSTEDDEVYLEAQIQNITPGPIFMERVMLEPCEQYTVKQLNIDNTSDSEQSMFGKANYMSPLDVQQYLYCLTPRSEVCANPRLLKGITNIGKLDIVWKKNMGEKGRLQTSALQRVAPGYGDVRVKVEQLPDAVPLETKFTIKVRLINCSERTMDLKLNLQNTMSLGLLWCGISGRELGQLGPNTSMVLDLNLITIRTGLLTISGLRLTDTFLKRTYEHDELAQIFVYHDCDSITANTA